VVVINCVSDEVVESLRIPGLTPVSLCLDPQNYFVYAGGQNVVYAFSPRGDSIVARVATGASGPWALCGVPFPNKLYVGDFNRSNIHVLDCGTNQVVDTVQEAGAGSDMVCDITRGKVYATDYGDTVVAVLDARSDSVLARIPVGPRPACPTALTWNPLYSRVYAVDGVARVVYVLRDTTSGLEELPVGIVRRQAATTVVAGGLDLRPGESGMLVDALGRLAGQLRPGWNDVSHLGRGVYFLRTSASGVTHKVLVAR
jgi:YVTN family beta-propeller protein